MNPVLDIRCSRRVQNALFYPFMVFSGGAEDFSLVGCRVTGPMTLMMKVLQCLETSGTTGLT